MNKEKMNHMSVLPLSLVNDIKNLNLSRIQSEKCIHIVSLIMSKSKKENNDLYGFIELPSSYLKKIFSEKYIKFIKPLLDNNIIMRDEIYIFGSETKCLYYKVNRKYNNDNRMISISYNRVLFLNNDYSISDIKRDTNYFKEDITQLIINREKLIKIVDDTIGNLNINNYRTNEQIVEDILHITFVDGNYEQRYITTRERALETAKRNNMSLIQDKRKFYIMDEVEFIKNKKNNLLNSYYDSIIKLDKDYYYAKRNSTNKRLDSNITNMCGDLMKCIIEDNDLVELDLMNSQFAILSYLIPTDLQGDDIRHFKTLSFNGELYDYIKEVIGLETRKESKQLTFELLFSSHKNKNPYINKLKEIFPSVINWINEYKKENGDKTFAIMLQKKESQMFIDDIWYDLKRRGVFALTKHDCLIVKKEDESVVRTFIQEYFDSIGFDGKLSNK